ARNRFNDYFALLGLARTLLRVCRGVFEKERDTEYLGKVFSALSDLEGRLGHGGQAMAFVQASLRYAYLAGNTRDCAIAHLNLANSLMLGGGT
ncbi:MAG: hypothetical protein GTO31_01095, partial [Xanthomonadales bacterium]|nr:hypothetical protein [Xanthomonadales bacterium]